MFIIIDWKIFLRLSFPVLLVYIFEKRKRHRKCDEYWTKNLAANAE